MLFLWMYSKTSHYYMLLWKTESLMCSRLISAVTRGFARGDRILLDLCVYIEKLTLTETFEHFPVLSMLMYPFFFTVRAVCAVFPRQACWPHGYIHWTPYLWCHCLLSTGFIISITTGLCEQPPISSSFSTSPWQCLKNLLCIHSLSWWVSRQCTSDNAATIVLAQWCISCLRQVTKV